MKYSLDDTQLNASTAALRSVSRTRLFEDFPPLFAPVLEGMTEGVFIANEEGIILYTNPAEDRMFGYGPGELVGQHLSLQGAYAVDENIRRFTEVIEQLKTGGEWTGECRN